METGTAILLGAGVGVAAWWLLRTSSGAAPAGVAPLPAPRPPLGTSSMPTDFGPFSGVLKLPGLAQAYQILAPIESGLVRPLVDVLNKPLEPVNKAINAPGTPGAWWSQNVGGPISGTVTTAVSAVGALF